MGLYSKGNIVGLPDESVEDGQCCIEGYPNPINSLQKAELMVKTP